MKLIDSIRSLDLAVKPKEIIPKVTRLATALTLTLSLDACSMPNPGWTLGDTNDLTISTSGNGSGTSIDPTSDSDTDSRDTDTDTDSDGTESSTTTGFGTDSSTTVDLGTDSNDTTTSAETDSGSTTMISETFGAVCGNGIIEGDEACDDGNDDNTDACLDTCQEASCGDGFVEEGVEDCDTADTTFKCLDDCTLDPCAFYTKGLSIPSTDKILFCSEVTDVKGACSCFKPTVKKAGAMIERQMVNSQFGTVQDLCDFIMPGRTGSNETKTEAMCFATYYRDLTNDYVPVTNGFEWDGESIVCDGLYVVNTEITCTAE